MKDDNDRLLEGALSGDPFDGMEEREPPAPPDIRAVDDAAEAAGFWPAPIPLGLAVKAPPFPANVFPAWLGRWMTAVSESLQCPLDLPGMVGLAVLSVAVGKKVIVRVRPDWPEPVNLYVAVILKSGESKSPAFRAAMRPVTEYVAEERKRLDPEIRLAMARFDVAERRLEQLKIRAAKADKQEDREKLEKAIEAAVFDVAAIRVPVPLRLVVDDITAESLDQVLRQQGGRIAVMSDEGGPFELMGGRYSEGVPNFEIYLKGYSGSASTTDRIGRAGGEVREPAITIGLTIQPEVLAGLQEKRGFRGRGLLARFLWAYPRSLVGERSADSPVLPETVRADYEEGVRRLLATPAERNDEGEIVSVPMVMSPEAYLHLVAFKEAIEPTLGPAGEIETIADWGNKLAGTIARIAGLLHVADRAHEPERLAEPIGAGETLRAIRLAEYLLAHARIAFDKMQADPVGRGARRILEWIERSGVTTFTIRDAYQVLRARFTAPAEMAAPLERLVEHDIIRPRPAPPRSGAGRPPSPAFDVNPAIHTQNSQNSRNLPSNSPDGNSVNSVYGLEPFITRSPQDPGAVGAPQEEY
jgi:hypothetical protein